MRPAAEIPAPPFPRGLSWVNVASLRMDKQRGRPVLVEFFDVFRPNSLRTLPYVKAWHERYAADGLRVISVHTPGFAPGRDEDVVRAEIARLGIEHAVCLDSEGEVWELYGVDGWPSRYLFDRGQLLADAHVGEGAYADTERVIQELLGVERELVPPLRPEDDPDALIVVPTEDRPGAYSGPYEAGAVWAVLEGAGELVVDGRRMAIDRPGAYLLVEHRTSVAAVLELEVGPRLTCHATCFSPGLAPTGAAPTGAAPSRRGVSG
ncbi:MAG TPA: DipZ protein [Solirubrobacteraceae bacterium]|nr:DipZ protein [Solirubrobacteraceae bacterium]